MLVDRPDLRHQASRPFRSLFSCFTRGKNAFWWNIISANQMNSLVQWRFFISLVRFLHNQPTIINCLCYSPRKLRRLLMLLKNKLPSLFIGAPLLCWEFDHFMSSLERYGVSWISQSISWYLAVNILRGTRFDWRNKFCRESGLTFIR